MSACTSAYKNLQRTAAATTCAGKFKPSFKRALYQAQVNVAGRYISGLLMIKAMPDSSTRIVFASETGVTFFDFEFYKNNFKVYQIFPQMNRKAVIRTLRKDFALLLMQHINAPDSYSLMENDNLYQVFQNGKDFYYYITDSSCKELQRMERGSRKIKVAEAMLFPGKDNVPDSIGIKHYNFNFEIGLKRLNNDSEK